MKNPIQTIENFIDQSTISMLGSVDENGFPNMKAMLAPRKRKGLKELFFTTNTSSMRVRQFLNNPKASVYFFDKRFFRGVMLKGIITVLTDTRSKEEIWQKGDEIYYSLGVTDPDYCVLKFTAQSGRYYSHFKSEDFILSTH